VIGKKKSFPQKKKSWGEGPPYPNPPLCRREERKKEKKRGYTLEQVRKRGKGILS